MLATGNDTTRGTASDQAVKELIAQAVFLGRSRIGGISRQFYGGIHCGPNTTAEAISRDEMLANRFMTVANMVQHGGGISATSLLSATMRMGHDRSKALAVTFAIGKALYPLAGHVSNFGHLWYTAVARGSLARALAMRCDSRLSGEAFLAGALQDIGKIFFATAEPESFPDLLTRSGGSSMRLALLEWQAFNRNHIHLGLEVLGNWGLPGFLTEAIGRHHTNPPSAKSNEISVRLWQIGYLVGALPIGATGDIEATPPAIARLLSTGFGIDPSAIGSVLQQALDEYDDVAELFRPIVNEPARGADLFAPAAVALDVNEPASRSIPQTPQGAEGKSSRDRQDGARNDLHGLFSTVQL